ncbi:MAG: T9SS type A sorting domain-containing protein [Flavobacteriales bacterium]
MSLFFLLLFSPLQAQFPPPAGEPGSTAIHRDSPLFKAWATGCEVVRGPQQIGLPNAELASVGEAWMATGKAGDNPVVSLGDGGYAILTFAEPIRNVEGFDFAVFENSFDGYFIELAHVEVSSDGVNFVRFPSISLTDTIEQIGPFGYVEAIHIHNLAGKYRFDYGMPFDLEDLKDSALVDINNITHVKIVDVVGSIDPTLGSRDSRGVLINDPFPTPFPSGGFDLDAVGVLHPQSPVNISESNLPLLNLYPNPATDLLHIQFETSGVKTIFISDIHGRTLFSGLSTEMHFSLACSHWKEGIYFVKVEENGRLRNGKFVKR